MARDGAGDSRRASGGSVLAVGGVLRVAAYSWTVEVASVVVEFKEVCGDQIGQQALGLGAVGLPDPGGRGGSDRGPGMEGHEAVQACGGRCQQPVGVLGHRTDGVRVGGRFGSLAGRRRGLVGEPECGGPQREGRSPATGQHGGQGRAGLADDLLAREVGEQPHRVPFRERPHRDPDGVQTGERVRRCHQDEHAGRGRDQRPYLRGRIGVVEHHQQPSVGHQPAEQADPVLCRRRYLLVGHAQLPQDRAQSRTPVERGTGREASQVDMDLPVGEPLRGPPDSPVHRERARSHAGAAVQQGDPGPAVGGTGRLAVEDLHRVVPVGEEPYGRGQFGPVPRRRRTGSGQRHGAREDLPGTRERGVAVHTVVHDPCHHGGLVRIGGRHHLASGDPADQAARRLQAPLPDLVGHPRPDRAQDSCHSRQRNGIQHVFPVAEPPIPIASVLTCHDIGATAGSPGLAESQTAWWAAEL